MPVSSTLLISGGDPISVHLHQPDGDPAEPRPTAIVTGSWLAAEKKKPDPYAAALGPAGSGASGGGLRQTEIPVRKIADLGAVVGFVRSLSAAAPGGPGLLAICASAQYGLTALANGVPITSFGSFAGWFHDRRSVAAFYGGPDGVAARLDRADA